MEEGWTFVTQRMCLARDTGHHGILFGGVMLQWLDEAGALFAEAETRADKLVTRALDAMEFIHPVAVTENVKFYCKVERRGRTSVRIRVKAFVERFQDASFDPKPVTEACMTFVAVDSEGRPAAIPWEA